MYKRTALCSWLVAATLFGCTTEQVITQTYSGFGVNVNDFATIQAAIDHVEANGGGTVFFPAGRYLIQEPLLVRGDYVRLIGESKASVIESGRRDMTLIHFSGSNGGVENLNLVNRQFDGITALDISPETEDYALSFQEHNHFENLRIEACVEGVVMRSGPLVGGKASGVWYNTFHTIDFLYTSRAIWLRDPIVGPEGPGSAVNRNQFVGVVAGNHINTGVWIDSGSGNTFTGCSFEGVGEVQVGESPGPSRVPTAVYIAKGTIGGANSHNAFISTTFEANALDLANFDHTTEFYSSNLGVAHNRLQGTFPLFLLGGSDPSNTPVVYPGSGPPVISGFPSYDYDGETRLANYYLLSSQSLSGYSAMDTLAGEPVVPVARHTAEEDWGLYSPNLSEYLPSGRFRVVVRYKLVAGSADIGYYNRTKGEGRSLLTLNPSDDFVVATSRIDAPMRVVEGEKIETYFNTSMPHALHVAWVLLQEVP